MKLLHRRVERRWKTNGLDTDRTTYRVACRMANKAINESRRSQHSQRISECVNLKQCWATIKNILHSCDSDNSHTENENLKLCHSFTDFFINKINDLKKTIEARLLLLQGPVFQDVPYSGTSLQNRPPVTPSEILKLLSSIPAKSSPMDFIPTSLIKSCPGIFSDLIGKLANLFYIRFPSCFKLAQVTPLLKKAGLEKDSPTNDRPISNLNKISKIRGRIFLCRILPHVTASHNFNPHQSAYRPYHSTETALLFTLNNCFNASDRVQSTILLSLDLSAAFDTIDHGTLLNKFWHHWPRP